MNNEEIVFITRGCGDKFDPTRFNKIENIPGFCKPKGGLWSSPEKSEWGWIDWCESEEFRLDKVRASSFRFKLRAKSKVYKIDSIIDLLRVPYTKRKYEGLSYMSFMAMEKIIDFEKMAAEYDAIWLTVQGESQTRWPMDYRFSDNFNLYGWDCETLLVLRPECIEVV